MVSAWRTGRDGGGPMRAAEAIAEMQRKTAQGIAEIERQQAQFLAELQRRRDALERKEGGSR